MIDTPLIPSMVVFGAVGLIVGSFIGAATIRMPRGETIITGRSRCDACGKTLAARELVPVLSYLLQRGRCRRCDTAIAIDQPIAELGGLIAGVLAVLSASSIAGAAMLALFGWALIALALLDARHLWLPDAITLPLIALGLLAVIVIPQLPLGQRFVGALAGYAALELLRFGYRHVRAREGLGAGDAKLLGAIGAWLGLEALPWIILFASLLGLAVVGLRALRGPISRSEPLPLGTFLSVTALVAIPILNGPIGISA